MKYSPDGTREITALIADVQNPSISNVDVGISYRERVLSTTRDLSAILFLHCGPFAANAVIPGSSGTETFDEYTKDGISIVKALRTTNFPDTYILRLAEHIGSRVDATCHDGTTTSMLFFSSLVNSLMRLVQHKETFTLRNVSRMAESVLRDMDTFIRSQAVSPLQLKERVETDLGETVTEKKMRYAIAYHQALIASKGDEKLATAVAEALSVLPPELESVFDRTLSKVETDEPYVVETRDAVALQGNMLTHDVFNTDLFTQLDWEDCDVILSTAGMVVGSEPNRFVQALLEPAGTDPEKSFRADYGMEQGIDYIERPLAVISSDIVDQQTLVLVKMWNAAHPDKKVALINSNLNVLIRPAVMMGVCAMADRIPVDQAIRGNYGQFPEEGILRHVSVKFHGHMAFIGNLYEKDEDEIYHPFYKNRDSRPHYARVLRDLKAMIDNINKKHLSHIGENDVTELLFTYRAMVAQKICTIRLGSTTHALLANNSVAEDAIGSALSALSKGVVFGGHPRLFRYLTERAKACVGQEGRQLEWEVLIATRQALTYVLAAIYRIGEEEVTHSWMFNGEFAWGDYILPELNREDCSDLGTEHALQYHSFCARDFLNAGKQNSDSNFVPVPILLQPAAGYYEQFKRFKDIVPKLINTTTLVDTSVPRG